MDASFFVALAALGLSIAYPSLARRDIVSKLEEWKEGVDRRNTQLTEELKTVREELRNAKVSVLENRIKHLEDRQDEFIEWKHHIYPKEYEELRLLILRGGKLPR